METTDKKRGRAAGDEAQVPVLKRVKSEKEIPVLSYPEILEEILRHVDFPRLKLIRSVCRDWNREICRRLARSSVSVLESEVQYSEFLRVTKSNRELRLPSPFSELSIFECGDYNKFRPLVVPSCLNELRQDFPITKLTLEDNFTMNLDFGHDALALIQTCSSDLTHLQTQFWEGGEGLPPSSTSQDNLRFPQLRSLVATCPIHIAIPGTGHLAFFSGIIAGAPKLEHLELDNIPSTSQLLRGVNLRRLRALAVTSSENVWDELKSLEIDSLTRLSLDVPQVNDLGPSPFKPVLSRFSATLENLELSSLFVDSFPLCPALTHLTLEKFQAGQVDMRNLPALRTVQLGYVVIDSWQGFDEPHQDLVIVPCPGVESVSTNMIVTCSWYPTVEKKAILSTLFQYFPNATKWEVEHGNVLELVRAAMSSSVIIRSLRISLQFRDMRFDASNYYMNVPLYEEATCQTVWNQVHGRQKAEARKDDIFTFASLRNLPDLEHLDLHNSPNIQEGLNMDPGRIEFDKLTKLKFLRYASNDTKPITRIGSSQLRHLTSVEVVNHCGTKWTPQDQEFLLALPNAKFKSGREAEFPSSRPLPA